MCWVSCQLGLVRLIWKYFFFGGIRSCLYYEGQVVQLENEVIEEIFRKVLEIEFLDREFSVGGFGVSSR